MILMSFKYLMAQDSTIENKIIQIFSNKDSLEIYYKKNKIPRSLIKVLKIKFEENFKMANPGKPYRKTDVITVNNIFLPDKQLIFLIKKDNYYGLVFRHGGRGFVTYFVFAEINSKKIKELWFYTITNKIQDVDEFIQELKAERFYLSEWLQYK